VAIILITGEKDSALHVGLEEQQNCDNQHGEIDIDLLMETRVSISNFLNNSLILSITILNFHNT